MRRRRFLGALLVPTLPASLLGACILREEPLRIGANLWPGYAPLRLAALTGALSPEIARVLDFPNSSMVLTAFRNGAIDAAAVTLDEVVQLTAHDQSLRVVLVFDFSDGGDVVIARPPIDRLDGLRGRRIAVETHALGGYLLGRALEHAGIAAAEVEVVSLPVDRHEAAFRGGEVDAVVTFEPVRSRLLAIGGRQLFSSSQIPGEIVDVLVVRDHLLRERRSDLLAVVRGHFAGRALTLAQPDDVGRRLGVRAGTELETFRSALALMQLPDAAANRRLLGGGEGGIGTTLARMTAAMAAQGLIEQQPRLDGLLVSTLVDEA